MNDMEQLFSEKAIELSRSRLTVIRSLRESFQSTEAPSPSLCRWMRRVEWEIARLVEAADQTTGIAEGAAAPSYSFRASGNIFEGEAVLTITDGTSSLAHPEGLTPDLPVQITLSRDTARRLRDALLDRPQMEAWSAEVLEALTKAGVR
jgi:hypothetical protein